MSLGLEARAWGWNGSGAGGWVWEWRVVVMGEWEEKKNPEKKWGGLVLGDEKYKRGRWSGGRFVGVEDGTLFFNIF
ncbi:unnamed protein product [Prunus armeniaca]